VILQFDLDTPGNHQDKPIEQISPQLHKFFQQILDNVIEHPEFQSAITSSAAGDQVMMEILINGVRYTLYHSTPPVVPSHSGLSPREREIVRLVAKGLPTKVIATTLELSPWTVCTHLRRIFSKLGVKSRAEMVASALKNNLLNEQ
jgi:DNA-binding NarL/FixJ family response regulator